MISVMHFFIGVKKMKDYVEIYRNLFLRLFDVTAVATNELLAGHLGRRNRKRLEKERDEINALAAEFRQEQQEELSQKD